jgi:hypothetical protein
VEWQIKKKPFVVSDDDFPLHPERSGKSKTDNSAINNFGHVVREETAVGM